MCIILARRLPEGVDEITLSASIELGKVSPSSGRRARATDRSGHGWIVVAPDKGSARGIEIDATSIDAAISDGNGGALLVGDAGSQAWFGALDARGVVRSSTMLGIDAPIDMVDILPGQDDGDRTGQPTWTRLLDHFRAFESYGGAMHHGLRGTAHFVARIPITGEGQSALAWLKVSPGFDGVLVIRQLAGTVGWQSAGFSGGRVMLLLQLTSDLAGR